MTRNNIALSLMIILCCVIGFQSCGRQHGGIDTLQPIQWNCDKMTVDSFDLTEVLDDVTFIPLAILFLWNTVATYLLWLRQVCSTALNIRRSQIRYCVYR